MGKNSIAWTPLPNDYIVSTIEISTHELDELITTFRNLLFENGDDGRSDLSTPGDFETMVFPGTGNDITDYGELDFARYATRDEALEGHAVMVARWKEMPSGIAREVVQDPGEYEKENHV